MNHAIELLTKLEPSPRFSADKGFPFQTTRTSTAVSTFKPNTVVGDAAAAPTIKHAEVSANKKPIAAELFSATAEAKIWTSRVAMHLDRPVRDRLFRQLDILHDADEWVSEDAPVNLESYKTCVRAILFHHINSRPSLALMPSGHVLALWQDGTDKLSVEFLPGNKTRWIVQSRSEAGVERAAGTAPLERLRHVIQPYCADRWFNAG